MEIIEKQMDIASLESIFKTAGIKAGDKVIFLVRHSQVSISKNPVGSLWGSLKSKKDALQLKEEAYESLGDMLNEKLR